MTSEGGMDVESIDASPKRLKPVRATRVGKDGLALEDLDDIMARAAICFQSRMLPREIQTIQQAAMIIMTGLDLGIRPTTAFKYLYITKARRPALTTRGQHALIYKSNLCLSYNEFIEGSGEAMRAVATTRRKGFEDAFTKDFSYQDAKDAGLLDQRKSQDGKDYDSTYQKYLKDMLLARARERVFGVAFPDVTGGIPTEGIAEEIDRNEAVARGAPAQREEAAEAHAAGEPVRALQAGGPDPLLEAIRGKMGEPELVEAPVEAEVVEPKANQLEPPPDEDEDPELF